MALEPPVPGEVLDALRRIDTCMVCNAIETFEVRLRNTGLADARIRGLTTSVVLTVFIVPAAYLFVYRKRQSVEKA
jgi:uncharacterized membrane protein YadS